MRLEREDDPKASGQPWLDAFLYFETCETRGIGQDWQIGGVHIWPILKTIAVGAHMHAGLDKLPEVGAQRTATARSQRARVQRLFPRTWRTKSSAKDFAAALGEDPMSERLLWCFGNASPMIAGPRGYAHVHFDPYRIYAARQGFEHWTLFYNEQPGDPRLAEALIGPVRSIANELAALDAAGWHREVVSWRERLSALFAGIKGSQIDPWHLVQVCESAICKVLVTRDAFRRTFERRRPLKILCFNYYQRFGWGMIAAAREAGIQTTDIQHGAQGRFHHAYHWARAPEGGWNVVPEEYILYGVPPGVQPTGGRCHAGAPSWYLWCRLAGERSQTGNLPARWRENAELLLADVRSFFAEVDARNVPWYLYASYAGESPRLIKQIEASLVGRARILIKRHPSAARDAPTAVERLPLPYALAASDGLITGYSATILEAAKAGTPCYALSNNASLLYEGLALQHLPADIDSAADELGNRRRSHFKAEERLADALARTDWPSGWL